MNEELLHHSRPRKQRKQRRLQKTKLFNPSEDGWVGGTRGRRPPPFDHIFPGSRLRAAANAFICISVKGGEKEKGGKLERIRWEREREREKEKRRMQI